MANGDGSPEDSATTGIPSTGWKKPRVANDQPHPASLRHQTAVGDEEAFAALFDATAARSYGLASHILGTNGRAAEVIKEAYHELWRSAAGRSEVRSDNDAARILMIVHRLAVTHLRSVESSATRSAAYQHRESVRRSLADAPDDARQASDHGAGVGSALASLAPKQRRALQLTYFEGFTCSEAAGLLNITQGSLTTLVRDGLIQLRSNECGYSQRPPAGT